ncbi:MAG: FAD-dependent oxidoreductase, partial [Pseudomonadota bacterium]
RYHWTVEDAPTGWTPGTAQVIRDTLSARIHPARACTALAAALRAQGVDMEHDLPVQGHVLHATGWQGLTHLRDNKDRAAGNGVKGQAALLGFDAADQPQLFIDGLHIIPHADGTTAIGATSEREAMDTTTDDLLEALIQKAKTLVPAIVDAPVLQRWAGIRPRARSRAPLLGKWPRRPGHYIANGGFKIGFGVAPKVAEVMADLILEGRDTIPAPFRTDGLAPWGFGA